MTAWRSFFSAVLVFAGFVANVAAHAVDLAGTFSGTVQQAQRLPQSADPPHPESYYEGAAVTGTFLLSVKDPQLQTIIDGVTAIYGNDAGSLAVSYALKGETYSFDFDPSDPLSPRSDVLLYLTASDASAQDQVLSFSARSTVSFSLTGPMGSLYEGIDPDTLHADPAVAYTGTTSFTSGAAEMVFTVVLSNVYLQTAVPVPEPATWTLLLAGAALVAWRSCSDRVRR
jgi:hypothetical protein